MESEKNRKTHKEENKAVPGTWHCHSQILLNPITEIICTSMLVPDRSNVSCDVSGTNIEIKMIFGIGFKRDLAMTNSDSPSSLMSENSKEGPSIGEVDGKPCDGTVM